MILLEGIQLNSDNNTFTFNWTNDDITKDIIPLKFQKFNSKGANHYGVQYYIAYKQLGDVKAKGLKDDLDAFKVAIKNMNSSIISTRDYENFINKAILGFDKFKNLSEFDIIIASKSSAPLLQDLVKRLKNKAGSNTLVFSDAFIKNSIENIKVNPSKLPTDGTASKKEKSTLSVIKSASKSGTFKMKEVPIPFRRYIIDFLIFNSETQKQLLSKLTKNPQPKILIVDDIYTGGNTFNEMKRLLSEYIPRENMFAFALLAAN